MFWCKKNNSRSDHLVSAGKARAKGNKKKAITLYQKMLEESPDAHEIHQKLAPLFAETRQFAASWASFKMVAEYYEGINHPDKAISMYSQATRYIPKECNAWEKFAALQHKKGHKVEALKTLLTGRGNFKERKYRYEAIRLLQKAWKLKPWDFQLSVDLARLLVKIKEKEKALKLLRGLAERQRDKNLR
ncbi:MAG: tetratricopeptide repeat protein, partial [Proteobacteria bacterium]|nr:tetratricopeptide repeat protein [Pseudomonadota bacterium]